MASVVFSGLGSPWLNLRAGRFEPAYAAFSVKRHLGITPYEVYEYAFPGGSPFSETREGVELTGSGRGFAYAAGLVNGSATNLPDDGPADVYARASMVIGEGEGQSAGQRIGVTGYVGRARPGRADPDAVPGALESFTRVGVDASLNLAQVNLAAQWLYGNDNRTLWGRPDDVCWNGFFAELSWQPQVQCVAFARYDLVQVPTWLGEDVTRLTGGGRYYFADNLALAPGVLAPGDRHACGRRSGRGLRHRTAGSRLLALRQAANLALPPRPAGPSGRGARAWPPGAVPLKPAPRPADNPGGPSSVTVRPITPWTRVRARSSEASS